MAANTSQMALSNRSTVYIITQGMPQLLFEQYSRHLFVFKAFIIIALAFPVVQYAVDAYYVHDIVSGYVRLE